MHGSGPDYQTQDLWTHQPKHASGYQAEGLAS